MRIRKNRHL